MATRLATGKLAIAGMVAPVWFITLVIVQGALQPDYNHISLPISALAAWPAGWIQNLNFFVSAVLLAVFAIGLNGAIRPTRFGFLGIALLLASSAGLWTVGVFPWINVNGVPTEPPSHAAGAVLTFMSASIGHVIVSRRLASDPEWVDLSRYVLGTGIVMLLLFIVVGGFAIGEGAPLHSWAGLLQRVLVVIWFACIMVMARRARRLAKE
jgi:hypothetical membrane protein